MKKRRKTNTTLNKKKGDVMTKEIIAISKNRMGDENVETVNARDLHVFLEVGKDFTTWIKKRIGQYDFEENQDFIFFPQTGENSSQGRGRPNVEYHIALAMAKELCMVERNDKGREARRYFIECERKLKQIDAEPEELKPLYLDIIHNERHIEAARYFEAAVTAYIDMAYAGKTREYHESQLQKIAKRKKSLYHEKRQRENLPGIGPEMLAYILENSENQAGLLSGNGKDLLHSILTSPIKPVNRTVGQMIFDDSIDDDQKAALEKNGIRLDNEFSLFINPGIVEKKLLKLTQWENVNIGNVLMEVPGSFRDRTRLDGQHLRGVRVPVEYLEREISTYSPTLH